MTRYVYWRQPNGKPYTGVDDKFALPELLVETGKAAILSNAGVSWKFETFRYETGLKPSIVVLDAEDNELNSTDAWRIIRSAMSAVIKRQGGGKPIGPRSLLKEADKAAANFFRGPFTEYVLVTSLSVAEMPSKSITVNGSTLKELKRGRKQFPYPAVVERSYDDVVERDSKRNKKTVSIQVKGRTIHEAASRALSDLALLRGLWTLFAKYGSWSISFGSRKPGALGSIHVGPVHTLHHPDGKPVDEVFWYDRELDIDLEPFMPSDGWGPIEKRRRWAMSRLKSLPYRLVMEDVLGRYAEALDQVNLDVAFIHLWSILEKITDTVGANYDETVRRAVWAYKDRKFASEMLGAMRLHRNRLVHAAQSAGDQDQVAYLIKSFVDPHLMRLLRNDFDVENLEQYGKQLSLPTNIDLLKKHRRRLTKTIRFFEKK